MKGEKRNVGGNDVNNNIKGNSRILLRSKKGGRGDCYLVNCCPSPSPQWGTAPGGYIVFIFSNFCPVFLCSAYQNFFIRRPSPPFSLNVFIYPGDSFYLMAANVKLSVRERGSQFYRLSRISVALPFQHEIIHAFIAQCLSLDFNFLRRERQKTRRLI